MDLSCYALNVVTSFEYRKKAKKKKKGFWYSKVVKVDDYLKYLNL